MKKLISYNCKFRFNSDGHPSWTIVPDIGSVMDGFWINDKQEFTKGSDGTWWIPPSAIFYVEKIRHE